MKMRAQPRNRDVPSAQCDLDPAVGSTGNNVGNHDQNTYADRLEVDSLVAREGGPSQYGAPSRAFSARIFLLILPKLLSNFFLIILWVHGIPQRYLREEENHAAPRSLHHN